MKSPLYLPLLSALVLSRLHAAEAKAETAVQRTVIPAETIEQLEANPNITYARYGVDQSNGELALWLDGKLATHIGPGTKTSKWTGEGFDVLADGAETFEGFRWRTVPELALSYFTLSHYVTENAYR